MKGNSILNAKNNEFLFYMADFIYKVSILKDFFKKFKFYDFSLRIKYISDFDVNIKDNIISYHMKQKLI